MRDSTAKYLKSIAPKLLKGELSKPTPVIEQRAIDILEILQDYQWHTSGEIAERLGIGRKYVNDILRVVQVDWGLMSQPSRTKGWKMLKEGEAIIV